MARLDVQEHDKKELNTPGGEEVMNRVGGKDGGLPFFAFLNEKGDALINSVRPGDAKSKTGNIGHPAQPYEVDWFMTMLQKGAPEMTPAEAKVLENYLRNQPK
jgi:hypothetical protein